MQMKLPSPKDVKQTAVKLVDEERELLKQRMLQWDGARQSRITLYDMTNKAELINELQGLGWKGYNGIAVEPENWTVRFDANLKTPAELFEFLEKEHNAAIQAELQKLGSDILPRIEKDPHHRTFYHCIGLHPFVVQYVLQCLKDSGWWVEYNPASLAGDKQFMIRPKEG
jgi:hypothetical protein